MSHFYASMFGQAQTETTRRGNKKSGVYCILANWQQAISLRLFYDPTTKQDKYIVKFTTWNGQGKDQIISQGNLVFELKTFQVLESISFGEIATLEANNKAEAAFLVLEQMGYEIREL